ncbi:hypothetical protein EYZ11_003179 [Aspergillus tanneri]|uniref:Uncharacterized protein n=1 Tax=Aspergillus tanneri TaxID=1220188 RepID=A0A4S3JP55_9EURO|nr:hypothetical protein EYZ11_003179 [Aspergillus tanneri]
MVRNQDSSPSLSQFACQSMIKQMLSRVDIHSTEDIIKKKNTSSGIDSTCKAYTCPLPATEIDAAGSDISHITLFKVIDIVDQCTSSHNIPISLWLKRQSIEDIITYSSGFNPGGLGHVDHHIIKNPPSTTL